MFHAAFLKPDVLRASPVPVAMQTGSRLGVSVIVPCRNEARSIDAFLYSLRKQDLAGVDWEVVIADGMSDDGTRDKLQKICDQDSRIRVIDNPLRIASTGLNAAIRAARNEIILRMDVHTEYKSDYIRRSAELLARSGAASVGGACLARGTNYVGKAIAAAFHSGFAVGGARWHRPTHEGPTDTVHLGCWRREVLEQVGLFDETLVRNQDDELNLRLRRAGGTIWQSPEIVAWYFPRASLSALFRQYFQYGFWRVAVLRKHRVPGAWRQLAPAAFVLANVLIAAGVIFRETVGNGSLLWLWAVAGSLDLTYLLASLVAAFITAGRDGWTLFPVLPVVFATYHLSYGVGFVLGIFYFFAKAPTSLQRETFFTQLSR
jgi:glycosyltransferase involved in cell wall biosynthesis